MSKVDLKIDWATYKAAKYACLNWHYSKTIPVNKLLKLGVWENGQFIGVVIFGLGTSPHLHEQFLLERNEVVELVRIALNNHISQVSRIIKVAIIFLKKSNPLTRIIVSFADPKQGHYGGIYQATNWIYTGVSANVVEFFFNGKWRHKTDIFKRLSKSKIKELQKRKGNGKYRYVMPLDKEMRKQILSLAKPYPKKQACQAGDDQDHWDSGGAAPTGTLQTDTK